MIRYFEWDFETGYVTEYTRQGECNGCGACCMTLIRWEYSQDVHRELTLHTGLTTWNFGNGSPYMDYPTGVYTSVLIGGKWRYFRDLTVHTDEPQKKCRELTDDLKCRVHMGKRLISSAWPMLPRHVAPFSECSYEFTEIARWHWQSLPPELQAEWDRAYAGAPKIGG